MIHPDDLVASQCSSATENVRLIPLMSCAFEMVAIGEDEALPFS